MEGANPLLPPCRPTLGNLLSSSMREMMFMGLLAIMSRASWLSVNSMCSQSMLSRSYSSCSSLNTCRTKNCCRCSLAKLMQSCSKLGRRGAQWTQGQGGIFQALLHRLGAQVCLHICRGPGLSCPPPSCAGKDTKAQREQSIPLPRSLSESEGELEPGSGAQDPSPAWPGTGEGGQVGPSPRQRASRGRAEAAEGEQFKVSAAWGWGW